MSVNSRLGPLVGREPAREADRQDVRVERRSRARSSTFGASPWRANWARRRPRAKMRELQLLAQVGLPQLVVRDAVDPLPEPADRGLRVEVVEVGVEVPLEQLADRLADPGRRVDAVRDAEDRSRRDPRATSRSPSGRGAGSRRSRRSSAAARTPSCRTAPCRRPRRGRCSSTRSTGHASPADRPVALEQRRRRRGGRGRRRSARCRPRRACGS